MPLQMAGAEKATAIVSAVVGLTIFFFLVRAAHGVFGKNKAKMTTKPEATASRAGLGLSETNHP